MLDDYLHTAYQVSRCCSACMTQTSCRWYLQLGNLQNRHKNSNTESPVWTFKGHSTKHERCCEASTWLTMLQRILVSFVTRVRCLDCHKGNTHLLNKKQGANKATSKDAQRAGRFCVAQRTGDKAEAESACPFQLVNKTETELHHT